MLIGGGVIVCIYPHTIINIRDILYVMSLGKVIPVGEPHVGQVRLTFISVKHIIVCVVMFVVDFFDLPPEHELPLVCSKGVFVSAKANEVLIGVSAPLSSSDVVWVHLMIGDGDNENCFAGCAPYELSASCL